MMIISRRQYEKDLKEAYNKGVHETEERCWQNERERRVFERIDGLETLIRNHLQPTEGCSDTNEKTCTAAIPHY